MSKIVCTVENGKVDVVFEGEHISKRELLLALKTIDKNYRRHVKEYQHCRKILDKETLNGEAAEKSGSKQFEQSKLGTESKPGSGPAVVAGKTGGNSWTVGVGKAAETSSGSKTGSVGK